MTAQFTSSRKSLICWVLLLAVLVGRGESLMVGRRRIRCSTPIDGKENVDALLDTRANLPFILGFIGMQGFLPSIGKCPTEYQFQPPWFTGGDIGGGFCPPEYWNLAASAPGLAIISAAIAWNFYNSSNRLLVTEKGLGTWSTTSSIKEFEEKVLFKDVEDWSVSPLGLVVKSSGSTDFFPLAWDDKSLEAVLNERIPK